LLHDDSGCNNIQNTVSLLFFKGKPIFSIDIHPDGSRFATGGQGNLFVFYILMLGLFIKQQALIIIIFSSCRLFFFFCLFFLT